MDWDKPREPTPAATDPGVHYWERHYTNALTLILTFLSVPAFVSAVGITEAILFGGDPFQNWQRGLTVSGGIGLFVSGYIWFINHRRVIAITDTTLHLGSAHLPFEMVSWAKPLSNNEARAIHRGAFRQQGLLPPFLMALAIRNSDITLMAPRYMPHKILIKAGGLDGKYLVAVRDPERFLAAFEQVKNVHEREMERRRMASVDPRYSVLDEVLEERRREQGTGQPRWD